MDLPSSNKREANVSLSFFIFLKFVLNFL